MTPADPLAGLPGSVEIVEVGPRDGLQNEPGTVDLETRIALIERLIAAGLRRIEVGAFVSPKSVPQMAGSGELLRRLGRRAGICFSALVPNLRGLEAAIAAGVEEIAVFGAASETFSRKNINCSIAESLERFRPVVREARAQGMRVRGYVSCVAGCPYEGEVAPAKVVEVTRALFEMGCFEVSLGDTIGTGTPGRIAGIVRACSAVAPIDRLGLHLHDTYGQALANCLAGLLCGVRIFDASVAGLGGCPYAPGASGNLATEDLLYMLQGMGIETGVDLDRLLAAGRFITDALGRPPASRVARALGASCPPS